MDKELKMSVGSVGDDAEFRKKMAKIQNMVNLWSFAPPQSYYHAFASPTRDDFIYIFEPQGSTLKLSLYTIGGTGVGGVLTMDTAMEYVTKFSQSVLDRNEIRELHFLGYWRVMGVPRDFSRSVFF